MLDLNRVHKELREVESSKHLSGVSVELIGDDLTHLHGSLNGPEDTPYQGGIFLLDINLPCTVVRFVRLEQSQGRHVVAAYTSASSSVCLLLSWMPLMTVVGGHGTADR